MPNNLITATKDDEVCIFSFHVYFIYYYDSVLSINTHMINSNHNVDIGDDDNEGYDLEYGRQRPWELAIQTRCKPQVHFLSYYMCTNDY